MILTKEKFMHELDGLRLQLREAEAQVHTILGAIQAVEQLIALLDAPETEGEKPNES